MASDLLSQATQGLLKSVQGGGSNRQESKRSKRRDLLMQSFQALGQMQSQRPRVANVESAFSREASRRKRAPSLNLPEDNSYSRTGLQASAEIDNSPTIESIEEANRRSLAFGMIMASQRYGDSEAIHGIVQRASRTLRDPVLKHLSGISDASRLVEHLTPRFSPWGALTEPVAGLRGPRPRRGSY